MTSPPRTRTHFRILMTTPVFLPNMGGVEIHLREIGRRLIDAGHQVGVLTTDPTGAMPPIEYRDGLQIRRIKVVPHTGEARLTLGMGKAIASADWDLVHQQNFATSFAPTALWHAQRQGIPTAVTFHGGGNRAWMRVRRWPPRASTLAPMMLDASRPLLRRARALIVVAKFEIDDLAPRIRIPRDRFTLIPNGGDLPTLPTSDRVRDPDAPRLVSLGRLVPLKGHDRALEVFREVLAVRPGATLWIAGRGPEQERLQRRAVELGVADRVEISAVAPSERAEFARRLADRDVLIALSQFEAHPVAVMEALSLGLSAVVSDDRAGLRELADDGLAQLVSPSASPQEIAAAVVAQIDAPPPSPRPVFPTWDECAAQTLALYEQILRPGR